MHWQILLWPFRTTSLFLLVPYVVVAWALTSWAALDYWVAVIVTTIGLPVWYAVIGSLSLYAEKLLVQAATGLFDDPIESETDVNPFQRGLAFRMFICHLVAFAILYNTRGELSGVLILPGLLFPLIWLSVVLDESLLGGFQPGKMLALVRGLSVYYLLAVVLISGSIGYLHYTLLYASTLVNIVASAVGFLEANVLFGVLLYRRRSALNLVTVKSPEQTLAAELQAEVRAMDHLFHEIHTHTANGSYATAVRKLESFIGNDAEALDPLIHERLHDFQDDRLSLEHAVRYLGRLVGRGQVRKGWALMKECLALDERFRPPSGELLLALTRAAGPEDAGLVNDVLRDFARVYPASPLIPDALFRRARICIELLRDGTTGMHLLKELDDDYPEFAARDEVQRYRRRLKIR